MLELSNQIRAAGECIIGHIKSASLLMVFRGTSVGIIWTSSVNKIMPAQLGARHHSINIDGVGIPIAYKRPCQPSLMWFYPI